MKKIISLLLIFCLVAANSYAEIRVGTYVIRPVTVGDQQNTFGSAYEDEIIGGYKVVADLTARDAISTIRRVVGMICYVISENRAYRLVGGTANTNWQIDGVSSLLGNVGIETMTPVAKLQVDGAVYINAGAGPSHSEVDLGVYGDVMVGRNMEIDGLLYVDNSIYLSGFIYGDGTKLSGLTSVNPTTNALPKSTGTMFADSGIYADSNGNVGIGVAVSAARLQVDGALYVNAGVAPSHPAQVNLATAGNAMFGRNVEIDGIVYVDGTIYGTGIGLTGIPATGISYDDAVYTTVEAALNYLLYVPPTASLSVSSVTDSPSVAIVAGALEIGTSVTQTSLAWTISNNSKPILSQSLNHGIGSITPVSLRAYSESASYGGLGDIATRTYTITVTDGQTPVSASASVYFRYKRYWGVNVNATLTDADIIALNGTCAGSGSELSTTRVQSRSLTLPASPLAYIYIVYPEAWGIASFKLNTLPNTDWTRVTQTHVNAAGYSTANNYYVYRTNNLLGGQVYTIDVN